MFQKRDFIMLSFIDFDMARRIVGIISIIVLSFFISSDRKKIAWKKIFMMLGSIFVFAFLLLKTYFGIQIIAYIASGFESLYHASDVGINFLFGSLSLSDGPCGYVWAIKILPIIVFFSALVSALYYLGVIQFIVEKIGNLFFPIFGTSGPETMCAVANSFLGQTEAPLLIRNYLKDMSKSEMFVVMVSGMGTISGALMAVYASFGVPIKHLLVSSIISIPSTILIAKLWMPETKKNIEKASLNKVSSHKSLLEALSGGTTDGLMLSFNVGAMLLVIISIIHALNNIFWYFGMFLKNYINIGFDFSLEGIFGFFAYPAAWILGVPSAETASVASFIGTKVAINEMIAYSDLISSSVSYGSICLATYALCGFSNFSSIGIQLGGIGAMEPSVRGTLSELGFKAVFAAAIANLLSACVAGLFI